MLNKDWAEFQVQIQPLARKLSEEMNRQEYEAAEATAMRLIHIAYMLNLYAAGRNEIKGGRLTMGDKIMAAHCPKPEGEFAERWVAHIGRTERLFIETGVRLNYVELT